MQRFFSSTSLAFLFSFASAFTLGCVITVGGDDAGGPECGGLLDHNDANCICDDGYERCNPDDPNDKDCCPKEGKDGTCGANSSLDGDLCYCDDGYTWCDDTSLDCCEDPNQTSNGTDGTGTGTEGTSEGVPTTSNGTTGAVECTDEATPPGTCDPNTEFAFCSHPESCGPEGSKFYVCGDGGTWVETPTGPDENCQLDGFDFGYGCIDNGSAVEFYCGYGPGTACTTGSPATCDGDTLGECNFGKLSTTDCFVQCTEIGDENMVLYDFGYCGDQDGNACICCDEGEDGCPTGGGSSTGGGSTSGGSSG